MFAQHHRFLSSRCLPLLTLYALGFAVAVIKPILTLLHPAYRGLLPYMTTDHLYYTLRVQEGLLGGDATNGTFSLGHISGLQPAGLETIVGLLLSWTNLSGGTVVQWVTVCIAPLILPLGYIVFRQCGSSRRIAFGGSILFFWIHLMSLERYVHQSWSFPCLLIGIILLFRWWQNPRIFSALIAGVWTGLMTYVYFWHWTSLTAMMGFLTLYCFIPYGRGGDARHRRTCAVLWVGFFLSALLYGVHMLTLTHSPFFAEASVRSALLLTREIESWPRSLLLFAIALCVGPTVLSSADVKVRGPLLALCIVPVLVLNQQLLHGRVVSFSTHYMPYIAFSVLVIIAWIIMNRRTVHSYALFGFVAGVVLLAPLVSDYAPRSGLFRINASKAFSFQHLAPVIDALRSDSVRDTVLTDQESALYVASHTDDDVVFVEFLRHLLIPTSEYAERYCLSEMSSVPRVDGAWVPQRLQELSAVGHRQIADVYASNTRIATQACCAVRRDPSAFLSVYGATLLLWNEQARPSWSIDPSLFVRESSGDGWSLWRLRSNVLLEDALTRRSQAYVQCSEQ